MLTALIDGDILCYTISSINEEFTQWDDDVWTLSGDAKKAAADLDDEIEAILSRTGADNYIICLTGASNFRKGVAESYKGNRTGKRKPFLLKPLREHIMEAHPYEMWEGLEADDIMGILASDPVDGLSRFIYSLDKDMWTIPGNIWDFADGMIRENPEGNADYQFFFQTLTGDQTDGYPGCPGVGKVGAKKALDANTSWATVMGLFEKKGLTEEDALQQARLARILRYEDYDMETHTVQLWSPEQ